MREIYKQRLREKQFQRQRERERKMLQSRVREKGIDQSKRQSKIEIKRIVIEIIEIFRELDNDGVN